MSLGYAESDRLSRKRVRAEVGIHALHQRMSSRMTPGVVLIQRRVLYGMENSDLFIKTHQMVSTIGKRSTTVVLRWCKLS
jgi:hypothetical protein